MDGLLRAQAECRYSPRPDARLGSGFGHGAAPAGQPGNGAGEVFVVLFQAGHLRKMLPWGAVGMFSGRLMAKRPRAWSGSLGPEEQGPIDLGGVQDEHGTIQCCSDVSVG